MRRFSALISILVALSAAPAVPRPTTPRAGTPMSRRRRSSVTTGAWPTSPGKTDADAVFGMIYAQSRGRLQPGGERYLTALGRTARPRAEAIWADLRQKLFIDPRSLKADYAKGTLAADADDRLGRRPELLSRHPPGGEAQGDQPLRTLDGAELHRGQHRRRYRARLAVQLEAFYGKRPVALAEMNSAWRSRSRRGRTASPSPRQHRTATPCC